MLEWPATSTYIGTYKSALLFFAKTQAWVSSLVQLLQL